MACGKYIVGGQGLTGLCANQRKRHAALDGCQSAAFQDTVLDLTNSTGDYHFDDTPALRGAIVSYADTRITILGEVILQLGPWITNVKDYENDLVKKRADDGEAALWKTDEKKPAATPKRTGRDQKKAFKVLKDAAQKIFDELDDVHALSGIGIQYKEKVQHASDPSALTAVATGTLFRLETLRNNWLDIIEFVNCAGDLATWTAPEWVITMKPPVKEDNSTEEASDDDADYDLDDDSDDGGQGDEEAEKDGSDASGKDSPPNPPSDPRTSLVRNNERYLAFSPAVIKRFSRVRSARSILFFTPLVSAAAESYSG
jgi:hypothetical protein